MDTTRGFTLVELCSVIVIMGVLMALAGPRLIASPAFNQRGYTDELGAALRTAGAVALASGCDVQFRITRGVGYRADQPAVGGACSGGYTQAVARADGTPLTGTAPSNADVSAAATLVFAPTGTVTGPTAIQVVGTPSGVTQPLQITIDPSSGFVTVP